MAAVFPSKPSGVPRPLRPLIGREREVLAVSELLLREDGSVVTLVGPGGVGKTRLARHIMRSMVEQFADGAMFVSLEATRRADLVLPAIARALGIGESGQGSTLSDLIDHLAARQLLLVLDNVEHVVEVGPALGQLAAACPGLRLLTTSREPLHLTIEQEFNVPPLPLPPGPAGPTLEDVAASAAVQLFVERARAVQPAFTLTQANATQIAQICRRLDGLPLAIELAAARMKVLSPDVLLAHLASPLPLLTGGPRDAPARQRTMRDAISWSYNLLQPEGQQLFRRLGVFVGGFTLDAAIQVGGAGAATEVAIIDGVSSLVDQNLVVRSSEEGEPRFTMLETIREFAREALAQSGEEERIRGAHADYFCRLAEEAEPALRTPQQPGWIARLEVELPNLRAVLDWSQAGGDAGMGLRLAGALYWFWFLRNHVSEGRSWYERARPAGANPSSAAARAATGAALLAWRVEDYEASEAFAEEARVLFEACADPWGVALVVHHLGHIAEDLHQDADRSIALLTESLDRFAATGDAWGVAYSQRCLARIVDAARGDRDRATALLQDAAETFRTVGDPWNLGVTLHILGDMAREQGQWELAVPIYQESLALHWDERDRLGVRDALLRLAQILIELGDAETAIRLFGCAETQRDQTGVMLREPVRASYEQPIEQARARLGADRFAAAWQAGRELPLDRAVDIALGLDLARDTPAATADAPDAAASVSSLSAREQDVLRYLVEGRTDREIADALSIGVRTVHTHVAGILNKLGVASRTAAATKAMRDGLIAPP